MLLQNTSKAIYSKHTKTQSCFLYFSSLSFQFAEILQRMLDLSFSSSFSLTTQFTFLFSLFFYVLFFIILLKRQMKKGLCLAQFLVISLDHCTGVCWAFALEPIEFLFILCDSAFGYGLRPLHLSLLSICLRGKWGELLFKSFWSFSLINARV